MRAKLNVLSPGALADTVHRRARRTARTTIHGGTRRRTTVHGSGTGARRRTTTATHVGRDVGAASGLRVTALLAILAEVETSHVELISHVDDGR